MPPACAAQRVGACCRSGWLLRACCSTCKPRRPAWCEASAKEVAGLNAGLATLTATYNDDLNLRLTVPFTFTYQGGRRAPVLEIPATPSCACTAGAAYSAHKVALRSRLSRCALAAGKNYGNNLNGGIFLSSNMFVTFGGASQAYSGLGPNNPPVPTLHVGGSDNSVLAV